MNLYVVQYELKNVGFYDAYVLASSPEEAKNLLNRANKSAEIYRVFCTARDITSGVISVHRVNVHGS